MHSEKKNRHQQHHTLRGGVPVDEGVEGWVVEEAWHVPRWSGYWIANLLDYHHKDRSGNHSHDDCIPALLDDVLQQESTFHFHFGRRMRVVTGGVAAERNKSTATVEEEDEAIEQEHYS